MNDTGSTGYSKKSVESRREGFFSACGKGKYGGKHRYNAKTGAEYSAPAG
jgi:hypothetical protein